MYKYDLRKRTMIQDRLDNSLSCPKECPPWIEEGVNMYNRYRYTTAWEVYDVTTDKTILFRHKISEANKELKELLRRD